MGLNVDIAINELVKGSLSSLLDEHWQIDIIITCTLY